MFELEKLRLEKDKLVQDIETKAKLRVSDRQTAQIGKQTDRQTDRQTKTGADIHSQVTQICRLA